MFHELLQLCILYISFLLYKAVAKYPQRTSLVLLKEKFWDVDLMSMKQRSFKQHLW